jgi:hypothetical protein
MAEDGVPPSQVPPCSLQEIIALHHRILPVPFGIDHTQESAQALIPPECHTEDFG